MSEIKRYKVTKDVENNVKENLNLPP